MSGSENCTRAQPTARAPQPTPSGDSQTGSLASWAWGGAPDHTLIRSFIPLIYHPPSTEQTLHQLCPAHWYISHPRPILLRSQHQEALPKEASRTSKTSPQSHPWDSQDPHSPHLALHILHANCKGASLCLARAFLEGANLACACMLLYCQWYKKADQQYLLNWYKEAGAWWNGTIQVTLKLVKGAQR